MARWQLDHVESTIQIVATANTKHGRSAGAV
jgi:hypothetical protein